jgi:putative protein kinase ArgK-like GTPase of G3E family
VKTVASDGQGVPELAKVIASYEDFLRTHNLSLQKKVQNWQERLVEMLRESLLERVLREHMGDGAVSRYAAEIAEHKRDPYSLVEEIVGKLGRST